MALADLLSQLDARPGVRGRQFERICAWYLRNAPEYRERIGKVWLWSEWSGAWAADAGIDLVAEERDGRLWAIQAKAYDPSYAIRKADVDSFLSESSRPQFSYRLLIATTDRLGPGRVGRSIRSASLSAICCARSLSLRTCRGLPRRMICGLRGRRVGSRFRTFVKRSGRRSGALRARGVGS
jgi:Restriction endonuclease